MKGQKVNLNLTPQNVPKNNTKEDVAEHLKRLAATASIAIEPVTEWECMYFDMNATPYEGLDPHVAYRQFKSLLKDFAQTVTNLHAKFDHIREESNIQLNISEMVVIGEEKNVKLAYTDGVFEGAVDKELSIVRDLANIVTVHTKGITKDFSGQKKIIITETTTTATEQAFLYPVNATEVRRQLGIEGESNIVTRDAIYHYFANEIASNPQKKNETIAIAMHMYSSLAYNAGPKCHITMTKEEVVFYNKNKPAILPEVQKLYRFHSSKFRPVTSEKIDKIWLSYFQVMASTGGSKSSLFHGHVLLDIPSSILKHVEQAFDILAIANNFGFEAVTLEKGDASLAKILIASGLTVYCGALSTIVEPESKAHGVYISGSRQSFYWSPIKQVSPHFKDGKVKYPDQVSFSVENTFAQEYLTQSPSTNYRYFPSYSAAKGICIKTNSEKNPEMEFPYLPLISRFASALACRSQYIYIRVPFISIDPCKAYFRRGVTIPHTPKQDVVVKEYLTFDDIIPGAKKELNLLNSFFSSLSSDKSNAIPVSLASGLPTNKYIKEVSPPAKIPGKKAPMEELGKWYMSQSEAIAFIDLMLLFKTCDGYELSDPCRLAIKKGVHVGAIMNLIVTVKFQDSIEMRDSIPVILVNKDLYVDNIECVADSCWLNKPEIEGGDVKDPPDQEEKQGVSDEEMGSGYDGEGTEVQDTDLTEF